MKLTTYFRLKKPEGTDVVNVDDFNENFDTIDTEIHNAINAAGDASESYVLTTAASSRANINSGDTFAVIVGKIMKWFNDLKDGAFSTVVNNDSTTASGYVADARIVKTHGDEIDNARNRISALEQSFPDGCNTIYNGAVTAGVTPTAKTPSALATAYTTVKNHWIHNDRQGTAVAADVRDTKTFTNSSGVAIQGQMPSLGASNFNGAFTSETAGESSSYQVRSTSAGYVANNTQVKSIAAGTNSTAINTTAATGTQTINIVPGVYNKIKVNQTPAYTAGQNAGDVAGRDASKILTVYNFDASHRRLSVTATLPAGNHKILYWSDTGSMGPAYMHTATVTYGSTTLTFDPPSFPSACTYKNSSETTSSTYYVECPFTLSGNTSVTITMTLTSNDGIPAIAAVI